MDKIKDLLLKINVKKFTVVFCLILAIAGIFGISSIILVLKSVKDESIPQAVLYGRFPSPNPTGAVTNQSEFSIIFTGDVIPARSVNRTMVGKNDFTYPFLNTADFLKSADLTIINLEAPLVTGCPVTDSGMVFCGDPRFIEGLKFSGIDVASLANNHAGNYGKEGVDETVSILNGSGIETTGIHNIAYKDVKGVKFAFLGYNGVSPFPDYLSSIDKEKIQQEVSEAKKNADIVVVIYHWSAEYSPFPVADSVAPFDPVEIAHLTVDSGADLVVGNHPHWVQGYENYKGKMIFYALGNFVFDQMWSWDTRIGTLLKANYIGKNLESFEFFPIMIDNYSQPRFLEGTEKQQVLDMIESRKL
ncbi:CapA family protein [Candidatus Gottesmanbacteria bacterium]|nr:CapA family protein [Candidatus Gottesmanbacteria bacterium]